VFSIKSLAMAAAVSVGVIFAMPVASQATTASVKIHTGNSDNVSFKNKSNSWIARHCAISNDVKCRHHYTRRHHHGPYYGHYKSGVTVKVY
jgi:hypothetical protein